MNNGSILIVDDDEVTLKNLSRLIRKDGYHIMTASTGSMALELLRKRECDLVIADLVMEDVSGLDVLEKAREFHRDIEVIVITGYASIPSAIEAMKKGAFHFLEKPFRADEVRHLVGQAMEKRRLKKQVAELREQVRSSSKEPVLVGRSKKITEVIRTCREIARTDCNVLLVGESGTGKELAASLIHHNSRRKGGKFLAINCGAFSEELLANELFGHEKGAFTGAGSARAGLLESTSGGTLLLDEVGDMPLAMQVKLLRAIENQEIIRVGGNRPVAIDVRIIAATHQDLKKAVDAGLFRGDLYYRLNVISIIIPPLRERKQDIPLLAHYFLERAQKNSEKEIKGFSEQAMDLLVNYNYPGNVRELENIVERAVAMARGDTIGPGDLPPDLTEIEVFSFEHGDGGIKTLREVQREYIQWVLNRVGRNKSRAAKLLGINRASLWRRLNRDEIDD